MTPADKRPSDPSRRGGERRPGARSGPPARGGAGSTRRTPGGGGPGGGGQGRGGPGARGRARGAGGRPDRGERDDPNAGPRQWGSLARKGARRLGEDLRGAGTAGPDRREPEREPAEEWIDEGPVREVAKGAVRRAKTTHPAPTSSVDTSDAGVAKAVGARDAARFEQRVRDAAKAYERERYGEARTALVPLAERMPANAAVRELLGLTYYRLGRWKQAIAELEAFRELTSSTEQHPVLADCYRALRRWGEVDALWDELREVSPSAELVTEGRIVAAGALADRDRLVEAIALLDKGFRFPKHPQGHHLRRAYALADLRERAGDLPQARSLFERIEALDPEFGDVADRVRSLR